MSDSREVRGKGSVRRTGKPNRPPDVLLAAPFDPEAIEAFVAALRALPREGRADAVATPPRGEDDADHRHEPGTGAADGVDRSLIRARLALTPLERHRLGVQEARAMARLGQARPRRSPPPS